MAPSVQQSESDELAEHSAFVRLLETKTRVKVLDVLMRHSYVPLTESEIADRAGVDQSAVNRNIDVFVDLGVVAVNDGWPTEYRVDRESEVVQGLEAAQTNLLEHTERLHEDDVEQAESTHEWETLSEEDRGVLLVEDSATQHEQSRTTTERRVETATTA